jgi:hypothetical protein
MTATAGILIIAGVVITFAPEVALAGFHIEVTQGALLGAQIAGALYFGFGMLNWFCKGTLIGGIYNRPVAIGNFSHFMIAALAIGKFLLREPSVPNSLWIAGVMYAIFAAVFGLILFTHPIKDGSRS